MDAILYFDTEDSISPPEAGCDDVVLFLADALTRHGVKGCFHVIGDKARILEARGRRDVIEAVKRHDVSSHFDHGSVHPTTTELVAPLNWVDGVNVTLRLERPGFATIERIFGKCSGLTRHGGSYAPQIVAAAGVCAKVYHGVPFVMPDHWQFWYAGTLCSSIVGLIHREGDGGHGPGYFREDSFADWPTVEKQLAALDPVLREVARRRPYVALFGCHPVRLLTTEFPCVNYYQGVNRPTLRPPNQRPRPAQDVIAANFDRFLAALGATDVNWIGLDDFARLYGNAPSRIPAAAMQAYAQRVMDCDDVPYDEHFSPAELTVGLAEALLAYERQGTPPGAGAGTGAVVVRRVIGPAELPGEGRGGQRTWAEVVALAERFRDAANSAGKTPATLGAGIADATPAEALSLFAAAYLNRAVGNERRRYTIAPRAPYPRHGDAIAPGVAKCAKWRVFPPDMDPSRIVSLSQAQTWSLKPAHRDAPAAEMIHG